MTTIARTRSVGRNQARRLRIRHLWLVPGLGLALIASAQATALHVGLVPLLVFGIAPHLTVILGIGQAHAPGQLARRAVPLFNVMHQPLVPLAVLGMAGLGILPPFFLVGALAWLSHILVDLALGDGLRTADGYRRGSAVPEGRPDRDEPDPAGLPTQPTTAVSA